MSGLKHSVDKHQGSIFRQGEKHGLGHPQPFTDIT
jgi:hypothetical protein